LFKFFVGFESLFLFFTFGHITFLGNPTVLFFGSGFGFLREIYICLSNYLKLLIVSSFDYINLEI